METLPHLWYPCCAKCGTQAPRAGLGDAIGPHPVPHDVLTCAACRHKTTIDERTVWLRQPLEEAP